MDANFKKLFEELTTLGYVEQPMQEFTEYLNQQRVTDPHGRARQGKQVPFRFALGERSIIVWTTYSGDIDAAKKKYNGWVIILDAQNEPLLFSFPVIKTISFFSILYKYAAAFKELLEKWPKCDQCQYELTIKNGPLMHQRIFECMAPRSFGRHKKNRSGPSMEALTFLSEENYRFLKEKFGESVRYQEKKLPGTNHRRIDRYEKSLIGIKKAEE